MFDASKLIKKFHDDNVTLGQTDRKAMQGRRNVNFTRLKSGLEALSKPAIADTINQGGNAMQTMTYPPEGDKENRYDIDMGVVFESDDAKTPETTKGWVRDAITEKATNIKKEPEAKKKCVRVIYAEGYQCDFPVFKRISNGETYIYKIAIGDEWNDSDPEAINRWFSNEIKEKSPEDTGFQLRRIVRFAKYFSKVHTLRTGLKFPAGLVITALVVECYQPVAGRDDEAFFKILTVLKDRSPELPVYANGIQVSDAKDRDRIQRLRDAASNAVEALRVLAENEENVTHEDALKAWKKVFRHSFFEEAKTEALETKAAASVAGPGSLAISEEEQMRRAEEAVREAQKRGPQSKPWSS